MPGREIGQNFFVMKMWGINSIRAVEFDGAECVALSNMCGGWWDGEAPKTGQRDLVNGVSLFGVWVGHAEAVRTAITKWPFMCYYWCQTLVKGCAMKRLCFPFPITGLRERRRGGEELIYWLNFGKPLF